VDEAIEHLQKAIQLEPKQYLAHYELANALIKKGKVDEGIAEFKQTLELNPKYADAHRYLGVTLLYDKNQPDEAIQQFKAALDANPEYAEAYNFLGIALLQKGRPNEAAGDFVLAVELHPHYVLAENNLAWLVATSPEASLRNGTKAVALAEDADQTANGQNPMVTMTLAAAYAEAGRFPDAIATAQRAIQLADAANNNGLEASLKMQLQIYQSGSPFRTPGQTNTPAPTAK
jgi:tetratricopeptide (TPR) repeat protein